MDRTLQVLYVGAASFAVFMLVWIFGFPASWRLGNTPGWEESVQKRMELGARVPPSLVLKYSGQRAVQFTHSLPAGVWSFVLPFQLQPRFRKAFRKVHRCMGYTFFSSALLMMIGFAIIEYKHLDAPRRDFPSVPLDEATSAIGLGWVPHREMLICVGVVFSLFAALALRAIIRGDFVSHRKWVLRHIGMGIWIAPQRMYLGVAGGETPREQKANFMDGTIVGLVLTVLAAELAVWIYHWQSQPKGVAPAAAEVSDGAIGG